jgi:predicted O-methyltransferase YrrM
VSRPAFRAACRNGLGNRSIVRAATKSLKRLAAVGLRVFSYLTAPAVGLVARTGIGADQYLKRGALPVPLHYYQPVFDSAMVPSSVWERRHDMPGVGFREENQLGLLRELGRFGEECDWPEHPTPGEPARYYWNNASFSYASACLLHAMVRFLKPSKVIEVGAGMSTLVFDGALAANEHHDGRHGKLVTIDPYPTQAVEHLPADRRKLIASEVEAVPLSEFGSLGRGDILFIDSSHVVRTGGDVNFLYLDVLPRLVSGVVVHIHDIQLPYEYHRTYSAQQEAPKFFWTEQYLLHAFLTLNPQYEVLLAGYFLHREHEHELSVSFPGFRPDRHRATTSFYIQRQ